NKALSIERLLDLIDFHDAGAAVRAVADEGPFAFRVRVAHLHALDQDPVSLLSFVDGEDVVGPRIARFLHPGPHSRPFLARQVRERSYWNHPIAESGEHACDLVGTCALDHRPAALGQLAVAADLLLDLADRIAGDRGQDVRAAESDASRVVPGLIETRGAACGSTPVAAHDTPPRVSD